MARLAFSTKIILGLAVIALTIGYFSLPWDELFRSMEPTRQSYSIEEAAYAGGIPAATGSRRTQPSEPAPLPATWRAASFPELGVTFEYPTSWGDAVVVDAPDTNGTSKNIFFSQITDSSGLWKQTTDGYGLSIRIGFVENAVTYIGEGRGSASWAESLATDGYSTTTLSCSSKVFHSRCVSTPKPYGIAFTDIASAVGVDNVARSLVIFNSGNYALLSFEREYRGEEDLQLIQRMVDSIRKI